MAPAGLLFLLMMSSSLLLSSLGDPSLSSQPGTHSLQKRGKRTENFFTAVEYIGKVGSAFEPFIGLIPVAGPYINGLFTLAGAISTAKTGDQTLNLIKKEFENLNVKLDKHHLETKWDIWATKYSKYENRFVVAWEALENLLIECNNSTNVKRDTLVKNFKKTNTFIARDTKEMLQAFKKKDNKVSFGTEFGGLLSAHVRCHEKKIKDFTMLIYSLVHKANTVSHFICSQDKLIGLEILLADNAYDSAVVMFDIHKKCISDPDKYIREDITEKITENDKNPVAKKQLAKTIRDFLEKMFDRYNWIAVAFFIKNSKHEKQKFRNNHVLSETFIVVKTVDVTVAAARQVKGTHTKAKKVKEAIEKCFAEKKPDCHEVIEQLSNCKELVDGIKLKETYSAVHDFTNKNPGTADVMDAKEAPEDEYIDSDNPSETPYTYTGKCRKHFWGLIAKIPDLIVNGHFRVLIKSDEEMMNTSPCDKKNCGGKGKGKCVLLKNTFVAVCECEKGHYGQNCEETIEGYKKHLLNTEMPKK